MIRLQGKLDLVALEQSFTYLIRRHESMRTTFSTAADNEQGEPVQVVHAPAAFSLPVIPVANESGARRQAQVEATRPFDLTTGPLLRVQLFQLAETHHLLLLTSHHIISDGWSMDLLVKELTHAYTAYTEATAPTLPHLPIQYAEFAVWQRNKLSDERLEMQLSYWREQLTGTPTLLELPIDRPRPSVQSYHGAHYCFTLKSELVQRLQALSLASGTTLFMTMLAAFKVLLMRYSSQEDIVVGSPIANRNHLATETLMGFFVNTLVLRSDLSGNPTFHDLLVQIKRTTLAAFSHQDVPFEKVVEAVQPPRNLSHSPLFQVLFDLRQQSMTTFNLPDLTIEYVDLAYPIAKFDLTLALEVLQADAGLGDSEIINGILEYNTDLFDQTTIERMSGHFQALLEQIATDPHQPIGGYALLTDQERHQIVVEWNATTSAYPKGKPIHLLFEEQVERTPDAIAVVFAHEQLTYRLLNERANRLAHYLIEQGVGADMLVGICMDRSLAMVEGVLGILKAGGAYVPLDPSYPQEIACQPATTIDRSAQQSNSSPIYLVQEGSIVLVI